MRGKNKAAKSHDNVEEMEPSCKVGDLDSGYTTSCMALVSV